MLKPVSDWKSSLEKNLQATKDIQDKVPNAIELAYQKWLTEMCSGIEIAAPYKGKGVPNAALFSPLVLPKPGLAEIAAEKFSTCWFTWYSGIIWAPPPPAPPFSAILTVVSSPMGAAQAKIKLFTTLLAEFKSPAGVDGKTGRIAEAFYQATAMAGVMITGLAIGSPPPPLVIPQVPIQ